MTGHEFLGSPHFGDLLAALFTLGGLHVEEGTVEVAGFDGRHTVSLGGFSRMAEHLAEVLFEVVNARLNGGGANGFHVLDAVDHQLTGAVVVEAAATWVVEGFAFRVLSEGFVLHAGHQAVEFLAQQGDQPVLYVARQAHGREMRRHCGDVAAGVGLGDHEIRGGRATLQ